MNIDIGELAYLQKENSQLKDELAKTKQALDVAVEALKLISLRYLCEYADKALAEIRQIIFEK